MGLGCRPTAIVGQFPSADSIGSRILNMFNRESRPFFPESVVESTDSVVESADSTADLTADPVKITLWVRAFSH